MTEQNVIRVMIADDHTMLRKGLTSFLETFDDFELVGQAANGVEAVRLCGEIQPDVLLMDLIMPEMDGVAATRAILEAQPNIQIIALTSFAEEELVHRALEAGASGYILKNVSREELAQTIRDAHAGKPTLAPEATRALLEKLTQPAAPNFNLTDSELEILALLIAGLNNRQIAEQLVVSRETVKTHVSSILSKLGVASRAEAVGLAVRHNLIK